jgi:hypothetical protein
VAESNSLDDDGLLFIATTRHFGLRRRIHFFRSIPSILWSRSDCSMPNSFFGTLRHSSRFPAHTVKHGFTATSVSIVLVVVWTWIKHSISLATDIAARAASTPSLS